MKRNKNVETTSLGSVVPAYLMLVYYNFIVTVIVEHSWIVYIQTLRDLVSVDCHMFVTGDYIPISVRCALEEAPQTDVMKNS